MSTSILTFNEIKIGDAVTVEKANFVAESGICNLRNTDITANTKDGKIHRDRKAQAFAISCKLWGNYNTLETIQGLSETIILSLDSTPLFDFLIKGIATANYNNNSRQTTISINCDAQHVTEFFNS